MKALGFRQANAWLHTWSSLLLGWLLYAIFVTGTISFFREEISFWMKPELHASIPATDSVNLAVNTLSRLAPDASQWTITLPGERNGALQVHWFDQGEKPGKGGGHRLALNAQGQPVEARETRGGNFLYRFHFELYGIPQLVARWIVGIATMMMLVAIVSGVITHKKIFKDFFTFRPRKGQRSWLDAHNALAVLALPFHLMITYSGLVLLMFLIMPFGMNSAYQGDRQSFFNEMKSSGRGAHSALMSNEIKPSQLIDLQMLVDKNGARLQRGVGSILVSSPNTSEATVELRQPGSDNLLVRGDTQLLRFSGISGEELPLQLKKQNGAAVAVFSVLNNLHLARFAGAPLRWFFFLCGLLGTAMVATGLVLWVVKRLPTRQKERSFSFGHRLVEALNVGTIVGLPIAIAAYFWANRLIPTDTVGRADLEITAFFCTWALSTCASVLRPHRCSWVEQLIIAALLYAALPVFGIIFTTSGLVNSLPSGNWLLAGTDLTLIMTALIFGWAAWKVINHQPALRSEKPQARPEGVRT